MFTVPSASLPRSAFVRMSRSRLLRKYMGRPYLRLNIWIWKHLPASLGSWRLVCAYGVHLQSLIQMQLTRAQSVGTFFFRNRPELELAVRLIDQRPRGAELSMAILGCSKGAEVYSFSYAIKSARPDLIVSIWALDISKDILEFAEAGVYSFKGRDDYAAEGAPSTAPSGGEATSRDVAANTSRDQPSASIFERMSPDEMEAMFDREGDLVRVKPRYREGINWRVGNAGDPALEVDFGLQDIVIANRFLCHMHPEQAEACLRQLARLVKPGGYLFVSGVDLSVRSKIVGELGFGPVTELIKEIHDGDPSVRRDWPLGYWGLEPFDQRRIDWQTWYASVFQRPLCSGIK